MSYGTGSGEIYLSEMTLSYLEDTHQYRVVNATTVGGRLIDDVSITGQCNSTGSTATIDFLFGNNADAMEVMAMSGYVWLCVVMANYLYAAMSRA